MQKSCRTVEGEKKGTGSPCQNKTPVSERGWQDLATIRDVARRAGVSPKTVSRVINGERYVRASTAARVREAIQELGYHPSITARSLASNSTFLVGLVIPAIASTAFAMMIHGVEEVIRERGYGLLLRLTGGKRETEEELVRSTAAEKRVDGMLLFSNRRSIEFYEEIKGFNMPVVVIDRLLDDIEIPQVSVNNRKGTYLGTKHLIETGRARIAYLSPAINTWTTAERQSGYLAALREYGLDYRKSIVAGCNASREQGYQSAKQLMEQGELPDGIVAFNDLMAIGAMQAIKEKGLTIPQDVAVVGFDDLEVASIVEPQLTTVRQPLYEIGKEGCRLLFGLIESRPLVNRRIIYEPVLVVRGSSTIVQEQ